MKTPRSLLWSLLVTGLLIGACSPQNPKRQAPPTVPGQVSLDANQKEIEVNPGVDILFVIDNSESMEKHQQNLMANIDKFANAFENNTLLDFHIGVTTVYDSSRYGTEVKEFNPLGQLIPLKSKNGDSITELPGPRFVTKDTPNYVEVLRSTLGVGVKKYKDGGPEKEESFSPVLAAVADGGVNAGFYRPDAALVVMFITDANDSSPNLAADFFYYDKLLALKGGNANKVLTYGVLAIPNSSGAECKTDPSGPPVEILKVLNLSRTKPMSLCSNNFGQDLANIGVQISEALSYQLIKLPSTPAQGTISVVYGSQEVGYQPLAENFDTGWTYLKSDRAITIGSKAQLKRKAGAKIRVSYQVLDTTATAK